MIKAIETSYNGYRFRSRLEARWAIFFDAMGIEYEYEKEGFELDGIGRYLPDFWLPNAEDGQGAWVEIKGEIPTEKEQLLAGMLARGTQKHVYLFAGQPYPKKFTVGVFNHYTNHPLGREVVCDSKFHCDLSKELSGDFNYPYSGDFTSCMSAFWGLNFSKENAEKAFKAARSARFEYGETPTIN